MPNESTVKARFMSGEWWLGQVRHEHRAFPPLREPHSLTRELSRKMLL